MSRVPMIEIQTLVTVSILATRQIDISVSIFRGLKRHGAVNCCYKAFWAAATDFIYEKCADRFKRLFSKGLRQKKIKKIGGWTANAPRLVDRLNESVGTNGGDNLAVCRFRFLRQNRFGLVAVEQLLKTIVRFMNAVKEL